MAIDIKGVSKVAVLVALYNAAKPAVLHGGYPRDPMDPEDAKDMLQDATLFSWVNGRALFVDVAGDVLDTSQYDTYNGALCAGRALAPLVLAVADREPESDRDFVSRVIAHAPITAGPKG